MSRLSSRGTIISIEDPNAELVTSPIIQLTRARPCVLTFDLHEPRPALGEIIVVRGTGWASLDDRPFRVSGHTVQSVTLQDSDTSGEATDYGSGASFEIPAWLELCRATVALNGPAGATVDVTTLCDEAHELVTALPGLGTWNATGFYDVDDDALFVARDAYRWSERVMLDIRFRDDSGATFLASVNTFDVSLGVNQAVTNALGGSIESSLSLYRPPTGHIVSTAWPWPDPATVCDCDLLQPKFWSGSLGEITADEAFSDDRATLGLAFDGNGQLAEFAAHEVRIAPGRGMWGEISGSNRVDDNDDLSKPAWIKSANLVLTQDLPSCFAAAGSPLGWRISATAPNQTITQSLLPLALSDLQIERHPNALFYLRPGDVLHGPIQLTQDGFVVVTDIRPFLIPGQWVQIPGLAQPIVAPPTNDILGVRIVDQRDSVGFMLANVERGYAMTTPIRTTGATNITRTGDITRQRMENFPSIWDLPAFTVLIVTEPRLNPLPPVLDPVHKRPGWTVWELNNDYVITGTGRGGIVDNIMTISTWTDGEFKEDDIMVVGTGVANLTYIGTQITNTNPSGIPNREGTYNTSTYLGTQTTSHTDIPLQARAPVHQGYGFNAATKPDDPERPGAQRIGLTVENESAVPPVRFGDDPQHKDYEYNRPNAEGFTVNTVLLRGAVALKGDVQLLQPRQFTAAPWLNALAKIVVNCQGPNGGGSVNGVTSRYALIAREFTPDELGEATAAMQEEAEAAWRARQQVLLTA